MNNNKKYKKWSLGLVAPALVLAPIAVVASCSSSGEEKEAYGIEFKATQIRAKIHNATQPNDLTDEQFKEEVLNHLDELFTVTGKLPADDFISKNIEIGELQKNNDKKEVSAKVKVNNANTDGKSIEETITLTGLGFDLTALKYTIKFKESQTNQEINLTDQNTISVDDLNNEKLMQLILVDGNKVKILVIEGANKDDITNDILANQILEISDIKPNKTEGKITFKLSVKKPENGAGTALEKTITFTGFKQEADSAKPQETVAKVEVSSVTLGLNGSKTEVQVDQDVNKPEWILERTRLLFDSGFELIKDVADITNIAWEEINATSIYIKFDIAANKWIQNDGTPGNNTKAIKIKITGLSSKETANQTLALKSGATVDIGLIDPELAKGTYEEFKTNSAQIFVKKFIFDYRMHLLTGDFSKILTEDDIVKDNAITITSEDSDSSIQIQFNIPKDKVLPANQQNDVSITIKFTGFATTK